MATVPGNALQDRFHQQARFIKKPGYGVRQKKQGLLIKLYDQDTIEGAPISGALKRALKNIPGRLYGGVKVGDKLLHLPFSESPEIIYAIYGDSIMLEGRTVTISYYDGNINTGEIEMGSGKADTLANLENSTQVYDIGGIFGV